MPVLNVFRDTEVGRMVTLPPREEEGEWEGPEEIELLSENESQGVCGDEGGPGPP